MAKAKVLKGQYFLFTNTGEQKPWCAPAELPTLDGVKELAFDTEATGKNKRTDSTPSGYLSHRRWPQSVSAVGPRWGQP
jgi:hypothetical protein